MNFQSEIGFTDIEAWQGSVRIFFLRLEVFPTKLDYRTDLLELRADLQMEVRSLVFELYGRTFQMLRRGAGGRSNDIEWLTLLRGEFEKLTHALDTIVRSPLQKVVVTSVLSRSRSSPRSGAEIRQYVRKHASQCMEAAKGHFVANNKSWMAGILRKELNLTLRIAR